MMTKKSVARTVAFMGEGPAGRRRIGLDEAVDAVQQFDRRCFLPSHVARQLGQDVGMADRVFRHHVADVDGTHPVADLQVFDLFPDFNDLTGGLMTYRSRKRIRRIGKVALGPKVMRRMLAGDRMGVGQIADACHFYLDQYLIVGWPRDRNIVASDRKLV